MFNKICVLGCGLIGSSLLRAIEKKKLSKEISAFDKSKDVSTYLVKNFSFNIAKNIDEAVKDSDLVIISSPLSSYKEILLSMKSSLKKNVILTDTGSAKKEVNKMINNLNLDGVNWIASHPIAGTEFSGPESGFAELFENRWCILSADPPSRRAWRPHSQNFLRAHYPTEENFRGSTPPSRAAHAPTLSLSRKRG